MSDTIVVMSEGRIQQIGTPTDIYNEPINSFVADFIGESNILNGVMVKDKLVHFCDRDFECVDEWLRRKHTGGCGDSSGGFVYIPGVGYGTASWYRTIVHL